MDTDRLMSVVDFPALRVSTPLHSPIGALIRLSDLSLPIFWIGEQWAVTAFGIECLVRSYAIAKDRLWENDPDYSWSRHMAEKGWVDTADFDAAFAFAARHFADLRGR